MATPYSRAFTNGRSSEMLFNDELHQIYESVKHLEEDPGANAQPEAKMDQAIWHDKRKNKLMWWDKTEQRWRECTDKQPISSQNALTGTNLYRRIAVVLLIQQVLERNDRMRLTATGSQLMRPLSSSIYGGIQQIIRCTG